MLFQNECWATCEGFDTWTEGECSRQAASSDDGREDRQAKRKNRRDARKQQRKEKKRDQEMKKMRFDEETPQKNGEGCACTFDYSPVCGEDGETYSNACSAKCEGVKSWTEGECGCTCGYDYSPVCGADKKRTTIPAWLNALGSRGLTARVCLPRGHEWLP